MWGVHEGCCGQLWVWHMFCGVDLWWVMPPNKTHGSYWLHSEIDHIHLSIEAQCGTACLPTGDCHRGDCSYLCYTHLFIVCTNTLRIDSLGCRSNSSSGSMLIRQLTEVTLLRRYYVYWPSWGSGSFPLVFWLTPYHFVTIWFIRKKSYNPWWSLTIICQRIENNCDGICGYVISRDYNFSLESGWCYQNSGVIWVAQG